MVCRRKDKNLKAEFSQKKNKGNFLKDFRRKFSESLKKQGKFFLMICRRKDKNCLISILLNF